ncbi:unnamed protein product, partial [Scytosiphon promiscuus]
MVFYDPITPESGGRRPAVTAAACTREAGPGKEAEERAGAAGTAATTTTHHEPSLREDIYGGSRISDWIAAEDSSAAGFGVGYDGIWAGDGKLMLDSTSKRSSREEASAAAGKEPAACVTVRLEKDGERRALAEGGPQDGSSEDARLLSRPGSAARCWCLGGDDAKRRSEDRQSSSSGTCGLSER